MELGMLLNIAWQKRQKFRTEGKIIHTKNCTHRWKTKFGCLSLQPGEWEPRSATFILQVSNFARTSVGDGVRCFQFYVGRYGLRNDIPVEKMDLSYYELFNQKTIGVFV